MQLIVSGGQDLLFSDICNHESFQFFFGFEDSVEDSLLFFVSHCLKLLKEV